MAREDLTHSAKALVALEAATITADANGATIDTSGFESVTFVGAVKGANGTADMALVIEESDDGAAFAPASADDVYSETVEIGADADDGPFQLGYRGDKRFVRLTVAFDAGSADLSAMCVLGHAREVPTYGAGSAAD